MKRILTLTTVFLLLLVFPTLATTSKLETFTSTSQAGQSAQMIWKLSGLGKPTADLMLLPNNNLLITVGKQLICVNPEGKILWQNKIPTSGTIGQPVVTSDGSLFIPGSSSVAQTRINGASGWKFTVYPGARSNKNPCLGLSSGNLLFLPLPDALYALDVNGGNTWILSPWDLSEKNSTRLSTDRNFLSASADGHTFYTVFGGKKGTYKLAAASDQGKLLWTYWLGDVISARVTAGSDERGYLATSAKKSKSAKSSSSTSSSSSSTSKNLNIGKIYCFSADGGSSPLWSYSFACSGALPSPVLGGNGLVYVSAPGHLWAFNATTGALVWDDPIANLYTPPAVDAASGTVYAGTSDSSDGTLVAVSPQGRLTWSRKLDGAVQRAPLISSDGYLYVITQKGSLYKIKDTQKVSG